jgi:AraC-like DNA-binding protein
MEFDSLEVHTKGRRVVLHECGFLHGLDWWMFPNQVSPFWRLYYNSVSGHHVVYARREIPLTPDRLVLIPDGHAFDSRGTTQVNHFWMTFSLAYAVAKPGPIVLSADTATIAEIQEIAACFDGIGTGDRLAVYHGSLSLLHRLVLQIRGDLRPGPRSESLARAVEYLHRHFAREVQIAEVARAAGLSPRALSEHFQKEYHCSPMNYLTKLRVGEAAAMLTRSGQDIDSIARATGFADRFYLSRVFKRMTGHSPAQYRRTHQRDADAV